MIPFLKRIPKLGDARDFSEPGAFTRWMKLAFALAGALCALGILLCLCIEGCGGEKQPPDRKKTAAQTPPAADRPPAAAPAPDLKNPVRPAPAAFPRDSNLPRGKESLHSGPIDLATFDPKRDLTRFEDPRVWFESDHDPSGKEDDHLISRAMETPLRRLVNLVEAKKGKLKIQDAYRPAAQNTVHLGKSLHLEGRAVDLTCEGLALGDLAKLCWQAGFDFVLYEAPKASGDHIHCSVKREKAK